MTIATDFPDSASSYNGYVFSAAMRLVQCKHRPIYDAAGRTVVATRHQIVLEDVLQATDQLDGTKVDTTAIREKLNVSGGQLALSGLGIGVLIVNGGDGSPRDAEWGPKPTELGWEDYGNGKAGKLTWQVECVVPEQCADPAYTQAVMEFNYDYGVARDYGGYSKRTLTGHVVIPMTRKSAKDRTIPDCVDRLKATVYPKVPVGFKRTTDEWKVSADRRRADFTYTDEEMPPNPPPDHAVDAHADHSLESQGPGFAIWYGTLNASYELARLRYPGEAWVMFGQLLRDRLAATQKLAAVHTLIPTKLVLTEPELHGRRRARFSCSYRYTLPLPTASGGKILPADVLKTAVEATSLWRDVPGTGYASWLHSMISDQVYTSRGVANLVLDVSTDSIIDLCEPQSAKLTSANVKLGAAGASRDVVQQGLDLPWPSADSAWLDYRADVISDVTHGAAELKPLPDYSLHLLGKAPAVASQAGYTVPYRKAPASVLQLRAGPSISIVLRGRALRAGYAITPPRLVTYGGSAVVPVREWFHTAVVANYGIPVVAAYWYMQYRLAEAPSQGVTPPANPLLGGLGGGQQLRRLTRGPGG